MPIDVVFPRASTPDDRNFYLKVSAPDIESAFSLPVEVLIPSLNIQSFMPNNIPTEPNISLPEVHLILEPRGLLCQDLPLVLTLYYDNNRQQVVGVTEKNLTGVPITISPNGTSKIHHPKIFHSNSEAKFSVRVNELSSWHDRQMFVIEIGTANPQIPVAVIGPFSVTKTLSKKRRIPSPPPELHIQDDTEEETILTLEIHRMSDSNRQLAEEAKRQIDSIFEMASALQSLRLNV